MKTCDSDLSKTLLKLLTRQYDLFQQLRSIILKQQCFAAENNSEAMLGMIVNRQKVVKDIVEINDKLRPIKTNWRKYSGSLDPQCKAKARKIAAQIEVIVAETRILNISKPSTILSIQDDSRCEELVFNNTIAKDCL